jgi:hypothetical protein
LTSKNGSSRLVEPGRPEDETLLLVERRSTAKKDASNDHAGLSA